MTPEPSLPIEQTTGGRPRRPSHRRRRRVPAGRVPVSRLRSACFALSLLLLVGAVPTLGWVGLNLIRDSKAGTLVTRVSDPRAPGYEAIVDPTPTALIIQRDAKDGLAALTFLALGGTSGGGSAMFLPVNTTLARPARPGDTYASVFRTGGRQALVAAVGTTLNAGLGDVIDMDTGKWAALTANTAPVEVDNPDDLTSGLFRFPAGRLSLKAAQIGPYLAALNRGESELNRLNRNELFWRAWLKKITASTSSDVIPGETKSGIGYFVRTLSEGPVRLEPMPVTSEQARPPATGVVFRPIGDDLHSEVATMVPYPTAPGPQARVSVRLLNGVDGGAIPQSIVQQLVRNGATIAVVGNDHRFGHATTLIQYRGEAGRNRAVLMHYALGGKGRLVLNLQGADDVDVTIVLGRDMVAAGRKVSRDSTSPTTASALITTTTRSTTSGG